MTKPFFLLLTLALSLAGCSRLFGHDAKEALADVDVALLMQHWVHAYEEEPEAGGYAIYRPADFKTFPPSWFRMRYAFHPDGRCDWFYLAPNDAHHFRKGTWRLDPDVRATLHLRKGSRTETFRIVELTSDLLRLAPVASPAKNRP